MHPLEGAARLARQWRMQNILVMRRGSKQMCCHPLPRSNPLTDRVESLLFIEESCPVLVSARMWARVLTGWTLRPSQEFLDRFAYATWDPAPIWAEFDQTFRQWVLEIGSLEPRDTGCANPFGYMSGVKAMTCIASHAGRVSVGDSLRILRVMFPSYPELKPCIRCRPLIQSASSGSAMLDWR